METSILIARIIGVIYLSVGIGFLLNRKYYHRQMSHLLEDPGYILLGGFISCILGMLIVFTHNVWSMDWRGIITLFGWLAIVKWVMLLVFPQHTTEFRGMLMSKGFIKWMTPFVLLLGIIFIYFGFFK